MDGELDDRSAGELIGNLAHGSEDARRVARRTT